MSLLGPGMKVEEEGAENRVMSGRTVLQRDRRQTVFGQCVSLSATAVDFSDGYNHGREKSLSVCWKGSTYSAQTDCNHFNPSLLYYFTAPKQQVVTLVIAILNMYTR
jgi:hypothetical protein